METEAGHSKCTSGDPPGCSDRIKAEGLKCTTILHYLCNHPNLFLNFKKTRFCNMLKCFPENRKMLNKCQSSPLLRGVTTSSKESSAEMTGTPELETHCLSQSPGSFLVRIQPGMKWEPSLLL